MWLDELSQHPSDIAKSAIEFLNELEFTEKTKNIYRTVILLFIDMLCSDPDSVEEAEDGRFLLVTDWNDYSSGVISNFIDWWLPRKWIGSEIILFRAPTVLRRWLTWCYKKGYLGKRRYKSFISVIPRNKVKEIKRLQEAAHKLFLLHTPDPEQWEEDSKVVPIDIFREPEDWDEGYMKILYFEGNSAYLENEEGIKVGPVMLSKELVELLRPGDVINVVIGKFGKIWKVLESGNVYADGVID